MYAEFLAELAELAKGLNELAKRDSEHGDMMLPYLGGNLEVYLDGNLVGHFRFEDDFVIYEEGRGEDPSDR